MSSLPPSTQLKEENPIQTFSLSPEDQTALKQLCSTLVTSYKEEGKNRVFQCKKCGKQRVDEWSAYQHVDTHHLPHVRHKCNNCPKVFSNNGALELHVQINHVTVHKEGKSNEAEKEKYLNNSVQEEQGVHKARITRKEKEPLSVEAMVYQDRASYVNK